MNRGIIGYGIVLTLLALWACSMPLSWKARAQEADLRARFFAEAKRATLADGRKGVNCCGEADAVSVVIIGGDDRVIYAEIVDTMRSAFGKVGDVIVADRGVLTIGLHNPFARPIAFINAANTPWCLSGADGG